MVQGRIDIVDSNCVDPELLHQSSVTETAGAIAQRVGVRSSTKCVGTAWLVAERVSVMFFEPLKYSFTHATPMI